MGEEKRMRRLLPEKYSLLKKHIENVTFNCFFARSVIEHHVNGTVMLMMKIVFGMHIFYIHMVCHYY
jgi:hypothetical protein